MEKALIKGIKAMKLNRYPDAGCSELKKVISKYTAVGTDSIAVGNGSDELIHMVLQAFTDCGDTIAVQNPTFSMYKIYGTVCGTRIWEYDLNSNFEAEIDGFIKGIQRERPKIVFLCNPNNPTGGRIKLEEIEKILKNTCVIIVVDEAYFEFSGLTAAGLLRNTKTSLIPGPFFQSFGLAGLRVGYMLASPE